MMRAERVAEVCHSLACGVLGVGRMDVVKPLARGRGILRRVGARG